MPTFNDITVKDSPWVDARGHVSNPPPPNPQSAATINNAIADIGTAVKTLLIAPGLWNIDADVDVPSTINLRFEKGAFFRIQPGKTVIIRGSLEAPLSRFLK